MSLATQVHETMARCYVPGAAVGLIGEGTEEALAAGVANIETGLPLDTETIIQCGSVTKAVTATLVMRLVDAGTLALDAPVRTHLPDLRLTDEDVAARVTPRHLLTHTGGWWGDNFTDTGRGDDALARYVVDCARLPQIAPLGEVWSYNNAGFCIAGRVVETVTGRSFETAMRELLFDPLGMTSSFFFADDVITRRFAVGHVYDAVVRPWEIIRAGNPSGAIALTIHDLLRFARLHLGSRVAADGLLLRPESVAEMQAPQAAKGPPAAVGDAAGLGWDLSVIDGVRVVAKGGALEGRASLLTLIPERGFALALLTNGGLGARFCRELTVWALAAYCGLRPPQYTPREGDDLTPYEGVYMAPSFRGFRSTRTPVRCAVPASGQMVAPTARSRDAGSSPTTARSTSTAAARA